MASSPVPIFKKRLDLEGFNASILQRAGGYLGLVRRIVYEKPSNFGRNSIHEFVLDSEFNVVSQRPLEDKSGRVVHKSWTTGPEDPRLVSAHEFYAVTCDTNDRWKPEVSKITMADGVITAVAPQRASDMPYLTEKNWILFNAWGEERHFLYSTHPFRFLRIDNRTGIGHIFLEYTIPGLTLTAHNGAVVRVGDDFLLSCRVKSGHSYKHSVWVLFDSQYKCKGVSPPFRFEPEGWDAGGGEFKAGGYEMNMSTHLESNALVCCVGIDDDHNIVIKYNIEDVLQFIRPV
jgi:hypothetical protein